MSETMHGRQVADPFRALEEDTRETWTWIEAQSDRLERYLEEHTDPATARRLEELLSIGYFLSVQQQGDRVFFLKREGDDQQPRLFVLESNSDQPRVLIDPNTVGEHVAIDWYFASPRGNYVAYGLSSRGDERSTLQILRVETAEKLPEQIAHTKWTSLVWRNDETGFYYTRFPREGEPDYQPEEEDTYFAHLFFHRLGTDPGEDPLFYRITEGTEFLSPSMSADDRFLALTIWHGFSQSDLLLFDLEHPETEPVEVSVGGDYLISGELHRDKLYIWSNRENHPRFRLLSVSLQTAGDPTTFEEIIPEGDATLEWFFIASDYLIARYVEDMAARLRLFRLDGTPEGEIELPTQGSVDSVAAQRDGSRVIFEFDSFFHPPTLYAFDLENRTSSVLDRVQSDIDTTMYVLEEARTISADSTPIHLFLVHRRGLPYDGNQPVLLTGYGGFAVSMLPSFQRNVIYWLERGGVFAMANLRGGGEFGEEWHRAGMLENKSRVFEDFEAVIRWLSSSGLSSPERIAITGGSNGGLLVGATITRCPEAFGVAVSSVGLYDMVRFHLFPPAEIWMSEYGNPENPEHFDYLFDYSPYHHVVDGTVYPSVLIETAENDTRVSWQHSTKFAARLQEANSSDNPVFFYMDRSVGHGAGSGLSDIVRQYVRMYTFIEIQLGLRSSR